MKKNIMGLLIISLLLMVYFSGCGGGSGSGVVPDNTSPVNTSNPASTPGTLVQVPGSPANPTNTVPSNVPKGTFNVTVQFPGAKAGADMKELTGSSLPYNSHTLRVTITGEAITTPVVGSRDDLDPSGAGTYTLTVPDVPVGLNTALIEVLDPSGTAICQRKHGFYMTPGAIEGPGLIILGTAIQGDGTYVPQNIDIPVGTTLSFQNHDYDNDRTASMNTGAVTVGPIGHATHITQPVTAEIFPAENHLFDTVGIYSYDGQSGRVLVYGLPTLTSVSPDKDSDNGTSTLSFTLTGTNFGTSRESVNGAVRFIQVNEGDPNNPWGTVYDVTNFTSWANNTTIEGTVDLPGGKYRVEVSSHGENTTETVFFYKGNGTYEVIVGDPSHTFIRTWGNQFYYPEGIAVDSSGNVYVADTYNSRIQKFKSDGTYLTQWGTNGTGNGQFAHPEGIAVDSSGNVYVADNGNYRIQKFDVNGNYLAKWGSFGWANGKFVVPYGVAVDSSGNVYVTDTGNYHVQKFDANGNYLTQFGSGQFSFSYPKGITVDSSGNVYVVDTMYNYIRKFNSAGTYITQWGTSGGGTGSGNGEFNSPTGVALDSSGNVYVVDTQNNRIQVFNSAGTYITQWGTSGSGNGQFQVPHGIALDSSGNVYVDDTCNNRVQVFGP